MKTLTLIFLLLVTGAFAWLGDPFLQEIKTKTKAYDKATSQEKIYVHTDKPFYFPGENIWLSGYLKTIAATTASNIVYVSLLNPQGNVYKTLKLPVKNGKVVGDFALPHNAPGGRYTLKAYTQWMRNFGEEYAFSKNIQVQQVIKPRLLLRLDFAKESYGASDTVEVTLEAKDLENNPITGQSASYKIQLAGKVYQTNQVQTDPKGKAKIQVVLPDTLYTNDATINIVVQHKGVAESVSKSVPVVLGNINLDFFPEGGTWVAGIENKMAFKAVDEFGKPADVAGVVLDKAGQVVQRFESFHQGLGAFTLTLDAEQSYRISINKPVGISKTFDLPVAKKQALALRLSTTFAKVKVRYYSPVSTSLCLVAQSGGKTVFSKKVKATQGWNKQNIALRKFPIGIAKVTLFDAARRPRCERLLFANAHRQLKVQIKTKEAVDVDIPKVNFHPREKVKAEILTTDHEGNPVQANLSVAVADNKLLTLADDKQDNILSYLLMSAELKGKVYEPDFYFKKEEPKALPALDYVMLTHGWRHYVWDKVLASDFVAQHAKEHYSVLSGRVVAPGSQKPLKATVYLFELWGKKRAVKVETPDNGRFTFLNLDPSVSVQLFAESIEGKKIPCRIVLDTKTGLNKVKKREHLNIGLKEEGSLTEVVVTSFDGDSRTKGFSMKGFSLPRFGRRKRSPRKVSRQPVQAGQIIDQVKGINGLRVQASLNNKDEGFYLFKPLDNRVSEKGYYPYFITPDNYNYNKKRAPVYLPVSEDYNRSKGTQYRVNGVLLGDPTQVADLDPESIQEISLEKMAFASHAYNRHSGSGTALITTKNKLSVSPEVEKQLAKSRKLKNGAELHTLLVSALAFSQARVYRPKVYRAKDQSPAVRTDFRNTIYWNPEIQTDIEGKASFSFWNNDALTSFKITVEGMGQNGQPGRAEHTYATKLPLGLQTNIPPYFTIGDIARIPVLLTNTTDRRISGKLKAKVSDALIIKLPEGKVSVPPHTTITVYIEGRVCRVLRVGEVNELEVKFRAGRYSQSVASSIVVLGKGFPAEQSFGGNTSGKRFDVQIPQVIKGSLKATLVAYPNVGDDLVAGVMAVIRQPHGCFEQVSAATYPNILALQFLGEDQQISPAFRRQALHYIKQGYRKLKGFETKEHGFDWYGKTPPHEGLTAFGLLEFMAMKQVYAGVSNAMIDRTRKWLLSRRDSMGGFRQNRGKYGFSAASKVVNNAYIVYALSKAGEQSITKEYNTAYAEALHSNDAYRMALLCLASLNFKKPERAKVLLDKLRAQVQQRGAGSLKVAHSIVRSGGVSLQIETCALIALAEMNTALPNQANIIAMVEYMLSKRTAGYFGSTQGTILALQVLIRFTSLKKHNNKGRLLVYQGNTQIGSLAYNRAKPGMITLPGLEKYLKQGTQEISIRFENKEETIPFGFNVRYHTLTPKVHKACNIDLSTRLAVKEVKVNEMVRLTTIIKNKRAKGQPSTVALVGIPSGLSPQPWQLKELQEKGKVAFYEVRGSYVVFYFRELAPNVVKTINLDLKATIPGTYRAPASSAYLYYTSEFKDWEPGGEINIQ